MPHKQKIKPLEKEKLVKRCESGELSLSEAAHRARVDHETVNNTRNLEKQDLKIGVVKTNETKLHARNWSKRRLISG